MQNLIRHFQRHGKSTTLPLVAISTTAAATIAFLSISPSSLQTKRQSFSTMSSPLPSTQAKQWPTRKYTSRNTSFPYTASDLTPVDTSPDSAFYSSPRFVTHIDDHAIQVLKEYYSQVLPHGETIPEASPTDDPPHAPSPEQKQTPPAAVPSPKILDVCSSWVSHYPDSLASAAEAGAVSIAGMGMNAAELKANPLFRGAKYLVRDLNENPTVPAFSQISQGADGADTEEAEETAEAEIDATTLTVSIDYLTSPVQVLSSIRARTKPGGTLHLAISNRCFPTKAVRRWLRVSEEERLDMVAEMLVWSGWGDVEILCLCDGTLDAVEGGGAGAGEGGAAGHGPQGVLGRLLNGMGMAGAFGGRVDPVWVVRGRKVEV